MLDALVSSFTAFTSPDVLLMLAIGVFLGYWAGILPGLGGLVTMSLLIPFTLGMDPFAALALLIGMYGVVLITGDLTSILVGVPGEPASAPLVLDGYGLAKRGLATRAMSAAVLSSVAGAIIGGTLLLLTIPVMRPLVLALGSGEIFMLTVLGLAMVASLSGRSILKGIATASLGLLLAAIGPVAGVAEIRYSFGQLYLLDGLDIIPFAVGLFAIPEVADLHRSRSSIARGARIAEGRKDGAWSGLGEVLRGRWLVLRTSLIGAGIGAIPGLGGTVAAWMAYGHAAQTSKDEAFGSHSFDGVLGPGAANNSKEGGGLIPTVAFGVPGTAVMAVLLGAFIVIGIQPGPNMVSENLDITYFLVWVLMVANILGALMALATLKQLGRVTYIRGTLLVPFVVALVLVGAGAATGHEGDLIAVVLFGLLAWFMRVYGWPVVPLLLGFVLGSRVETTLFLAIRIHGASFLNDPIVIILILGVLATLASAYRANRRRRERPLSEEDAGGDRAVPGSASSLVFAAFLLAVAGVGIWGAWDWDFQARLLPTAASCLAVVTVLAAVAVDLRSRQRRVRQAAAHGGGASVGAGTREEPVGTTAAVPASEDHGPSPADGGRTPMATIRSGSMEDEVDSMPATAEKPGSVVFILLYFVAFAVAVWAVGMSIAIGPFVLAYYRLAGREPWVRSIAIAAVAALVYWGLFDILLDVPAVPPFLL